jgi:hypothetical protein
MSDVRSFEVYPCGDPYSRHSYVIRENGSDGSCWYRGDLSPVWGLRRTKARLRRLYPGCRIKVVRR